jgi:hypothetical protein
MGFDEAFEFLVQRIALIAEQIEGANADRMRNVSVDSIAQQYSQCMHPTCAAGDLVVG